MAGDNEESWKGLLAAQGIEAEPKLKGLGEYSMLRRLVLNHLGEVMGRFSAE